MKAWSEEHKKYFVAPGIAEQLSKMDGIIDDQFSEEEVQEEKKIKVKEKSTEQKENLRECGEK